MENNLDMLLKLAISAAVQAGKGIMDIYTDESSDFGVEMKSDNSPLTIADKKSDAIISSYLSKTKIPVLGEEIKNSPYEERKEWFLLWVVDPLDGTKEFIKRNGEFTVNIALVEKSEPILGVIYVPVKNTIYFGYKGFGSRKAENVLPSDSCDEIISRSRQLPVTDGEERAYTVVASRSHLSAETEEFINDRKKTYPQLVTVSAGSSLKICLVCEGKADVYPRFAPTMEWDTAAGDGIARAMGLKCTLVDGNTPLSYNKADLTNPWFIIDRGNK